jgi:MFS family permease
VIERPAANLRALYALAALNFFMADMQAGVGPFLGVFLLAHGWQSGLIGTVMTIGGLAGMALTAPAGALVDASAHKRLLVIVPGLCSVLASAIVLLSQHFWLVSVSQVATAIAGAAIGPAVNGITLGIVRQAGFTRQTGINQAFNHAGNMVGAGLSGLLGWRYGMAAVFWLAAVFAALSIAAVLLIPRGAIDHAAARGIKHAIGAEDQPSNFLVLAECKPLLVLAAALLLFHLGNAAMLPLYGMAVVSDAHANGPGFVAATIVVAQGVMIFAALAAMRLGERHGLWIVLLISFAALPVRGVLAACLITEWGVFPVQFLDGVGAGLQSVAVPALVARMLNGTGRVNAGQGAVMTAQGIGAALSPLVGGWLAQTLGYSAMFVILGTIALGSVVLWAIFAGTIRSAAAIGPEEPSERSLAAPAAAA